MAGCQWLIANSKDWRKILEKSKLEIVRFTRRDFLKLTGLGGATLILRSRVPPPIRALRILAPSRSLATLPVRAFEREMNLKIVVETLHATSLSTEQISDISQYDLAVVPSYTITHLIRSDLVRELNLQSPISNLQRPYDPFNTFSQLASRGIIGINARGLTPPQTWKEFFNLARTVPTYLPALESHNAALKSFGESINTRNTHLRDRAQSLISNLQSFSLHQAHLTIAPPLDDWSFTIPREGVEMWEDSYCIPVDSSQSDLAQQFIEFALSKQKLESLPAIKVEMLSAFAPI